MNCYSSVLSKLNLRKSNIIENVFSIDFVFLLGIVILFSLQTVPSIILSYTSGFAYLFITNNLQKPNRSIVFFWLLFFLLVSFSVFQFNHGLTPIFYLFFNLFILLSAKVFANKSIEHIENIIFYVYLTVLSICYFGLVLNFDKPDPIAHIIPWASQNGITSNLIAVHITHSVVYYLKNKKLPILLSVLLLIICFYGLGRGSIIVSVVILLFSLIYNYLLASKALIGILLNFSIICIFFYFIYRQIVVYKDDIDLFIESTKFSQNMSDDPRKDMLNEYLRKLDVFSLFFGSSYDGTSIIKHYGGNPHNSFIRVHSFYGLVGMFSVFLPFWFIVKVRSTFKSKFIVSSLIIILLVRAISEPILFPTPLDFFYFLNFYVFKSYAKV